MYLSGLTDVAIAQYVAGTLLGLFPFSFVYVYASVVATGNANGPIDYVVTAIGLVVTVVLTQRINKVVQKALGDGGAGGVDGIISAFAGQPLSFAELFERPLLAGEDSKAKEEVAQQIEGV